MPASQLSILFFLQMGIILAACRIAGWVGRRLGQPQVVCEMVAGVFLGPSALGLLSQHAVTAGWTSTDWHSALFPKDSLTLLYVGAQLGVGLYMFLVGVEFRTDLLGSRARGAAAVSISGMLVPFALGAGLAVWLHRIPGLFSENSTMGLSMLFLAAAMCITAFPMLARIIYERGLTGTSLGTLALAAGAIDDAAAWCVLAIVLACFGAGAAVAVKAIIGGACYVIFMLTIGRRLLVRLGEAAEREGRLTPGMLGFTMMLLMLGCWFTDAIGIHAVFGGFTLGVAMPRGLFARELQRLVEPFAVVFLLPMFFTYSGLKTRLDLVDNLPMLLVALAVLVAACLGKGVACWAAARLYGEDNRSALAIGTLMNARGLMELIILSIGLQHGVILPGLFSVMVLMAIVTTLMASPVFEWVYGRHARAAGTLPATPPTG